MTDINFNLIDWGTILVVGCIVIAWYMLIRVISGFLNTEIYYREYILSPYLFVAKELYKTNRKDYKSFLEGIKSERLVEDIKFYVEGNY